MVDSYDALNIGGAFQQQIEDFIPRTAQQEMARAVEESLNYSGRLVVESGTGTGKTYAYLVPVVLSGKRAIISTGTKHLQEQIFYRDLPVVLRVLNKTLSAQMLKGRSNYLCRYRHKLNSQQSDLIGRESRFAYDVIDKWASRTVTGDVSEVSDVNEAAPIWKQVTSTADNCLGAKCPDYGNCFVNQARQRAMKADVVVVNHHLFFSDLTLKTEGFGELLPDHDAVIFDEAHVIPDTASNFFGISISSFQLKDLISDIQGAEKEERSAVHFSASIAELEDDLARILAYGSKLKTSSELLVNLKTAKFDGLLEGLLKILDELNSALVLAAPAGEGLAKCQNRCQQFLNGLDLWWEDRNRNGICWFECSKHGFKIHVTPLNVGEHFSKYIEDPGIAWIFTSATLAVGEDFSAFCNEIGLENAETRRWESPYDYRQNAMLFLPPDLPDPREHNFSQALTSTILDVTDASRGNTRSNGQCTFRVRPRGSNCWNSFYKQTIQYCWEHPASGRGWT
jgi:ATP-dependent DNA helicase DinG